MKFRTLAFVAVAAAGAVAALNARESSAKYEEPHYSVDRKEGAFEIRKYPQVIAAEVTVSGQGERAANQAFSILAGYIFGKNLSKQKIAMTVPVTESVRSEKIAMTVPVTTHSDAGNMTMRFFMPSNYSLETLPAAHDQRIRFLTVPPAQYGVVTFSGVPTRARQKKESELLSNYLTKQGFKVTGEPVSAFYNPPWTLPFLRRNEVWIPIE